MDVNTVDLIASLSIMVRGMFLLFACCGFIALLTMGLNKLLAPKVKDKKN